MPRTRASRRVAATATEKPSSPELPAATQIPVPAPPSASDGMSSDIYGHSDREHENLRQAQRAAKEGKTALGAGSGTAAQRAQARRRDRAMERLDAENTATSSSHVAPVLPVPGTEDDEDVNADSSVELGRDVHGTPQRISAAHRDNTGLDLDDTDLFTGLGSSFQIGSSAIKGGSSAIKHSGVASASRHGNYSTDTSTLSMGRFKRRSRAPSISVSGHDTGPIRPSSRGPNTPGLSSHFSFGQFKRRAREPSILGRTAGSSQAGSRAGSEPPRSDMGDALDLDSEMEGERDGDVEGEEEFAPEVESTPLVRRKSRRQASPRGEDVQPVRRTSGRKRKSSEGPQPDAIERVEKRSRLEEEENADAAQDSELTDSGDSLSELSLPSPRSITAQRRASENRAQPSTPVRQTDDDIMAPPASSDTEGEGGIVLPDIRALGKHRRRRVSFARDDHISDASSPPSLTHSPNLPATKRGAHTRGRSRRRDPSPALKTADLQSLLPRRRNRNQPGGHDDPYALDESDTDLDEDEDELGRPSRRKARRAPSANSPAAKGGSSRRGVLASSKSKQPETGKQQDKDKKNRRVSRTYGGQRASDKENEDDVLADDTFAEEDTQMMRTRMGDELTRAAKKFKEVDKWELEFEEVRESSPAGADAR